MCGIIGYYRFKGKSNTVPNIENFKEAFVTCSTRGGQATGFWSPSTGTVKTDQGANNFVEKRQKELTEGIKSGIVIGHCRAATSGFRGSYATPVKNENNHPHESKDWILVHNGSFSHLPEIKGYKYKGECDSELAVSYIQTFGIEQALKLFHQDDGYSLVFLNKNTKEMYFYRHTNPLVITVSNKFDAIFFGSTADIAYDMLPSEKVRGFPFPAAHPAMYTEENRLYKIVPEGIEETKVIEPRKTDEALDLLPNEIKDKLDLDTYKEKYQYRYVSRNVSAVRGHTVVRGGSYNSQMQEPNGERLPFVIIRDGTIRFTGPVNITA